MPRFLTLSADRAKTLGHDIVEGWTADNEDRQDWLKDLPTWLDAYRGRLERKMIPWPDASNVRVPVVPTVVQALHSRKMPALFKPEPIVGFKPQEPSDETRTLKRERFLDWAVRHEVNLFPIMDRVMQGQLLYGLQFVKASWSLEVRRLKDKHTFDPSVPIEEAVGHVLKAEEQYLEAVKRVNDLEVEAMVKGRKVTFEVDQTEQALTIYSDREEVVEDQPVVELVRPEDIVVPSNAPFNLQKAEHIYHRYWLTLSQVKARAKTGVFAKLSTKDLDTLESAADAVTETDDAHTHEVKRVEEGITGADLLDRTGAPDEIELLDAYLKDDLDDNGDEEEWLVTVAKQFPEIILRCVRLEEVYRHGMRPFVVFYHEPVGDRFWAIGVPQILEGLQAQVNKIYNQRNDAGDMSILPCGFYKPGAGAAPDKRRLEPGVFQPADDPKNDYAMLPIQANLAWASAEEDRVWALVEKVSRVNDLMLGRVSQHQGATRTAAGVSALTTQNAAGLDIYLRRDQESWGQLLQMILALYAQYMPPGKEQRILGYTADEETVVVTRDDLTGIRDMVFTGNSLSTDREIERNTVTFLAQSALNPGVFQFLLQLGIMQPPQIAEWYRYLFQVFDVPRLDKLIVIPKQEPVLTPEVIVNRTVAGELIPPKPGENNQQVIAMLEQIYQGPDAASLAPTILANIKQTMTVRGQVLQQEQIIQAIQQQMAQMQAMQQQYAGLASPPGIGGAPELPPNQPPRLAL
jgi:hypothetical protein